jgi:amino acid permease
MSNTALIEREDTRMSGFSDDMSEFEVLVQTYLRDVQYTSTTQAILNIVYSLVNVGLVALPYAASQGGIPLYLSTILIVSVISGYTNCVVISMANEQKVRTLEDLTGRAFGYKGYFTVCFLQIVFSLSLMCITLQVWGDICYSILNNRLSIELPLLHNRNASIVLGAIIVFPFCLFAKNMKTLKWTSYCSALLVITALLSVVVSFSYYNIENSHNNVSIERDVIDVKSYGWTVAFIVTFCFSYNQVYYYYYYYYYYY